MENATERASGPLRDASGVAKFRHEAVAVVLRVRGELGVLVRRRPRDPFAGLWALPSGPVEVDEPLGKSVARHVAALLDPALLSYSEQLVTRSDPGRDPFDRTIATAYLELVGWDVDPALPEGVAWLPVDELPPLAFDHRALVEEAVARLRGKLSYTNIGFALAPASFTIAQLRDAYRGVLGHDVSATNLQRVLQRRGELVETGETSAPGADGGRPARLYRFAERRLKVTDPFATLKPGRPG